jgi:multidrug resistance efflux pump
MLQQRAFAYLLGTRSPRMALPSRPEKVLFATYGLATVLYVGLVSVLVFGFVSTALEARLGGVGVSLFAGLLLLFGLWFLMLRSGQRRLRQRFMGNIAAERTERHGEERFAPGGAARAFAPGDGFAAPPRPAHGKAAQPLPGIYSYNSPAARLARWRVRLLLAAAAAGAIYVAFLPYTYETGGDFSILPDKRVQVVAEVPGEVAEIHVDEGDIVTEGQLLGRIADWQARSGVEITQAQLDQAQAALRRLLDGSTPEEIAVAREEVARAQAAIPFLQSQAERAASLATNDTMSASEAERLQSNLEVARQELRTQEANLARVEAGATQAEIDMAQAEVDRLEAELDYREDQLARTELVATAPGRVTTVNVALNLGAYLDTGDVFVEIEDHALAQAEVLVPESDIGEVQVGDQVRLRSWANPSEERIGFVTAIAPVAETLDFGRIVRVKTAIPNEEGLLRPGQTGYAKIEGSEMRVWEAYSRMFVRFFQVEVWGWIP